MFANFVELVAVSLMEIDEVASCVKKKTYS